MDGSEQPESQIVPVKPVAARATTYRATVWFNGCFADEWFRDAGREAEDPGFHARRREVVFALAAAESYLFEWVLRDVLRLSEDRFEEINEYFVPGEHKDVRKRFISVTQKLRDKGMIPSAPNLSSGNPVW